MSPTHALRVPAVILWALCLMIVAGCGKNPTKPTTPTIPPLEAYVSASTGSDSNSGTSAKPFKTLTHAIAACDSGAVIHVGVGTYDTANGEAFPLLLKARQTLIGDTLNKGDASNARVSVLGHGAIPGAEAWWIDQYATIIAAHGAGLFGLRIGSTNVTQHFAIVAHDVAATISDNSFVEDAYGAMFLHGAGASLVRENVVHCASYGMYLFLCPDSVVIQDNDFIRPDIPLDINILSGSGGMVVRRNWITGSGQVGIQVQAGAPLIEGNSFAKPGGYTTYGAIRCAFDMAKPKIRNNQVQFCVLGVTIGEGAPDLGTVGDPGGNFFYVTGAAVKHDGPAAISAIGNVWPHDPPTGGVDILVTGSGSVRWGTGAGEVVP